MCPLPLECQEKLCQQVRIQYCSNEQRPNCAVVKYQTSLGMAKKGLKVLVCDTKAKDIVIDIVSLSDKFKPLRRQTLDTHDRPYNDGVIRHRTD